MYANRLTGLLAVAVVVCYCVVPAFGQVDHRIRNNTESGAGRALDANKQVGSGGYNQATPSQYGFDYGQRSNEVITGNVTGLAGFQGISPIVANNAFRVGLPSAGLARFRAASVGIPEVTSGWLQGGSSYYDTQQIIPDAGSYSRGLNLPGSTMSGTPYRRPPMPFERDSQQQYLLPNPADTRLQAGQNFSPSVRQRPIIPGTATAANSPSSLMSPYANAAGSSIFGTPSFDQPSLLDSNRGGVNPLGIDPAVANAPNPLDRRPDLRVASDRPIGAKSPFARSGTPGDPLAPPPGVLRVGPDSPLGDPVGMQQGPLGPDGKPLTPGRTSTEIIGGDRFLDMVAAVHEAQKAGVNNLGFIARTKTDEPDAADVNASKEATTDTKAATPPDAPGVTDENVASMASAAKWVGATLDNPIKTFAGHHAGKLNDHMKAAEEELHRANYYKAANHYEAASSIDPTNPLPLLGRGHALAAAGDYMSAVVSIEWGIARFPQIAAFRIDLPAIVGRHDAFDVRRADLETRLETLEDYRLRFLLGYLEIYSGLMERGLRDLEKAAGQAPAGSMIALFPELITGKTPVPELKE